MKTGMALLLASALLAGCSSTPQSDLSCGRTYSAAQCNYLRDVQHQLVSSFNSSVASRYPGQTCLVSARRLQRAAHRGRRSALPARLAAGCARC